MDLLFSSKEMNTAIKHRVNNPRNQVRKILAKLTSVCSGYEERAIMPLGNL